MLEEPHSEYQSLTTTLHGWFDHEFKDLPSAIKLRLEKDNVHVPWDETNAQGRENLAAQIDYQNDPAYAEECEYWFNRYNDMDDLRDRIEEWERLEPNTPSDRVIKEDRIEALKAQLAEIDTSRVPPANLKPPTRTPRRRRDILSAVIDDAIMQAGSDDCETVWLRLRGAAQKKTQNLLHPAYTC